MIDGVSSSVDNDAGVAGGIVYSTDKINTWKNSTDRDAYPSSDMIRETYKNTAAQSQQYLGFSVGNDKFRSNTSLNYTMQNSNLPNTDYKRHGVRSNNSYSVNKYFEFGMDLSSRFTHINDAGPGTEIGDNDQPFPRCPWALDLSDKPFPGRKGVKTFGREGLQSFANMWYWESGFNKDQISEIELIRDHNFRAMYGAWDVIKNIDKMYPKHRLGWVAFIAGKRESRRLMGDVILDAEDFKQQRKFNDSAFPCSWHVDLHSPKKEFQKGFEENEFVADFTRGLEYEYGGEFWAPYRTLYSRNIKNLFMAGRCISVTKAGLGPVRVMKTCGMMGDVVGKAASICIKHNVFPRDVYTKYLKEFKVLLNKPGAERV